MKITLIRLVIYMFVPIGFFGLNGCKRFPDPGMLIEDYAPPVDTTGTQVHGKRKVLLITVDALNSPVINAEQTPALNSLLANSKYTLQYARTWPQAWPINSTASWGSMLTGLAETRLWDSTFYAVPVDSTNIRPVPANVTLVEYMQQYSRRSNRIAVVSPWYNLVHTLTRFADKKIVTSDDADTKEKLINTLQTDSANLFITEFNGVHKAGSQSGFGDNATKTYTPEYLNAVKQVDGYIGEVMAALKARPGYSMENWLTLITTTQASYNLILRDSVDKADPPLTSWFLIAHNDNFKTQELAQHRPAIQSRIEDITPLVLYWLKIPKPETVTVGRSFLDIFEIEYADK